MKRFLLLSLVLIWALPIFGQLSISLPVPGVYQSTGTNTSVVLAGQYLSSSLANYRIEYQVVRLNVSNGSSITSSPYNTSPYLTWTTITTNPTYGLFRTTVSLPVGWYSIAVRVWNINTSSSVASNLVKYGIGDVYVISGQSNAQGGSNSLPSLSTYDGILSHNYADGCNSALPPYPVMTALNTYDNIGPNGSNSWCWGQLGQQLRSGAPTGGMPIAFFNTAQGGSSSKNWQESAVGTPTSNTYTSAVWCGTSYPGLPQPYFTLKTTLQYYSSIFGVKALLWHQGETDNDYYYNSIVDRATYRANIKTVIDQTRSDFSSNLRWLISEATFQGKNPSGYETNTNVTSAQDDLVSNGSYNTSGYNYKGVLTDGYGTAYRDVSDLVHFREDRSNAVSTLGNLWYSKVTSASTGPIGAETPPVITMGKSGSNWTLTCSGTYSAYRWINMATANPDSAVGTSFSYSGSSGGSYACLVQNSSGKWTISQTIYTNCGSCREGALAEWSEAEEGIQTKAYPIPFDKKLTIEFSIPTDSKVRLELINENGQVIQKVTDTMHAKGTFQYPVTIDYNQTGILFYRLTVNDLAISKKLIKAQ